MRRPCLYERKQQRLPSNWINSVLDGTQLARGGGGWHLIVINHGPSQGLVNEVLFVTR
jgi:hypothetical protein